MAIDSIGMLQYQARSYEPPKAQAVAGRGATIDRKSELYAQCQDFESIFVKMMLSEMRKSVDKSGFLEEGPGQAIFEDMLDDEYAKSMTKGANFGLADAAYLELSGQRGASGRAL